MKSGESWDSVMHLFCEPNLIDDERWALWKEHTKKSKKTGLVDKVEAA